MFGYVKVFQPQLKICEYEQYKAVYCSLCRTLGKRYGLAARMTLSYDFTFLALFLMALKDKDASFEQGRCPFHPLKKRLLCTSNEILDYTADVAMLLMYHKVEDTIRDEGFFKRLAARGLRLLFKRHYKRAVQRRPEEAKAALAFMQAQEAVEASENPCVDACAHPTADFLAVLSSCGDGEQAELTKRFGYCLGRFVYLADAAQDLKEDLQKHRFNPYAVGMTDDSDEAVSTRREYAAQSLHACVAVCAECAQKLPFKRFSGIIRNVIYEGLPYVIRQICEKKQEESTNEKSV
ncbi:MAG: hypothetical protein E7553_02660 [Ruminococcaceae bacterium]|nr:hypothetical protein [Oscillospiraceae bacterium]